VVRLVKAVFLQQCLICKSDEGVCNKAHFIKVISNREHFFLAIFYVAMHIISREDANEIGVVFF